MSDGSSNKAAAAEEQRLEASRHEISECEKEITIIKSALRSVSAAATATTPEVDAPPNVLKIELLKIEGLPETAQPKIKIDISSPIESKDLDGSSISSSSYCQFENVETGQATLTITVHDSEIHLGQSDAYEVSKFTTQLLDPLKFGGDHDAQPITHTLSMPIVGDDKNGAAICQVELKTSYTPSIKDRKEELYELLNKITQRKAAAVEQLRSASLAISKRETTTATSSSSKKSVAVEKGFLNKKKKNASNTAAGPSKIKIWYQRVITILPVAKNYIIFVGFVAFAHFRGDTLAIPAPV